MGAAAGIISPERILHEMADLWVSLGKEGEARLKKLKPIMKELEDLMGKLDARGAGRSFRVAAE